MIKEVMKRKVIHGICATVLMSGLVAVGPLFAQTPAVPKDGGVTAKSGYATSPIVHRYQQMSEIMRDMSQEMSRMTEEMAKPGITPELRKQMAQKMKRMSEMMKRMSGLVDRPSMKEHDAQKHTEEMRKQMDAMTKDSSMAPSKK